MPFDDSGAYLILSDRPQASSNRGVSRSISCLNAPISISSDSGGGPFVRHWSCRRCWRSLASAMSDSKNCRASAGSSPFSSASFSTESRTADSRAGSSIGFAWIHFQSATRSTIADRVARSSARAESPSVFRSEELKISRGGDSPMSCAIAGGDDASCVAAGSHAEMETAKTAANRKLAERTRGKVIEKEPPETPARLSEREPKSNRDSSRRLPRNLRTLDLVRS